MNARSKLNPRANSRERLAFAGLQTARVAFYGAHYLAARFLARENVSGLAKPKHKIPALPELLKSMTALFARDWENVEAGLYPAPLDLVREARAAMTSLRYLADMPRVIRRQREGGHDEVAGAGARAGDGLPRYYRQNFHFQTDGYLSERSAKLYDFQVEALFAGTADAMRRRAYVPVADYLARKKIRKPVILDVGAGTGRFLSFVKSLQPGARAIALDLSEPYLARAQRRASKLGQEIETLAAPAEKIPLPDRSVDVVTSIYLFHELPPKIRRAVASEIARVLKPGGLFVFADSIQYGDVPAFEGFLDVFPDLLHEPYYASYAKTDLKQLFARAGLMPAHLDIAYFTKILSFEKPRRISRTARAASARDRPA
jgi:ubiquinone/menaquinone biosynthesis C-methylase UbiE